MKSGTLGLARSTGILALLLIPLVTACSEPLAPERDFLIRSPARRTTAQVPLTYTVSAASTDSITFEWSPAAGAERYTIHFARGENEAQVERLESEPAPFMSWEIPDPQIVEVALYPNTADARTIQLVRFKLPMSEVAAALQDGGAATGVTTYTLLSMTAHNGGETWHSSSLTPVAFRLQ